MPLGYNTVRCVRDPVRRIQYRASYAPQQYFFHTLSPLIAFVVPFMAMNGFAVVKWHVEAERLADMQNFVMSTDVKSDVFGE